MAISEMVEQVQAQPFVAATAMAALLMLYIIKVFIFCNQKRFPYYLPPVPAVPGLPLVGNLLQLKDKKPYKTFTKWAETYGPIYSIKTGAFTVVVISSATVAKEAMVTRYSSISTRKLSNPIKILTRDKCMVATSDYDDFHKMVKRYILASLLGPNAQKRLRENRDIMVENLSKQLHACTKISPLQAVNFRKVFESELFGIAMKQAVGKDVQSLYVDEIGHTLTRNEIFNVLVIDPMEGAIEVDWRDFFPYLKWVPNRTVEEKIRRMDFRRMAVMKALIQQHKDRVSSGEKSSCYLDFLLSESTTLTEEQIAILVWETIIETSDTTLVTTEWAMYELSRNPDKQDRLYRAIQEACSPKKISEDNLSPLPYLTAIFHETLRMYSPAPIIPLRYVHADTRLGGYDIPAGTQIAVNIYGCNMDKERWENPEEWNPERFLDEKYDPSDLYKTMAFGAGKRVCAGSLQAMLIACTAIGRLVQEFEWGIGAGEEANVNTIGLTTRKLEPLQVFLKPRREG